jgi:hypothetical protein
MEESQVNPTDVVSLMAAAMCAGLPEKAKPTHQSDHDRLANLAWDLYNAVQSTSSQAAQRLAARPK